LGGATNKRKDEAKILVAQIQNRSRFQGFQLQRRAESRKQKEKTTTRGKKEEKKIPPDKTGGTWANI